MVFRKRFCERFEGGRVFSVSAQRYPNLSPQRRKVLTQGDPFAEGVHGLDVAIVILELNTEMVPGPPILRGICYLAMRELKVEVGLLLSARPT